MHHAHRLMLITQFGNQSISSYLSFIETCAKNGITSVQLREKHLPFPDLVIFAQQLQLLLIPLGIPLIINDHLSLAKLIHADGVHLGQQDATPESARELLGEDKLIGLSIESGQELLEANQYTALNYVAASAVFPTQNKNNLKKIWGIDGLQMLAKKSTRPVIAIGGIQLGNAEQVMQAGASGIAVIGAVHDDQHPAQTCQQLRSIIDEYT